MARAQRGRTSPIGLRVQASNMSSGVGQTSNSHRGQAGTTRLRGSLAATGVRSGEACLLRGYWTLRSVLSPSRFVRRMMNPISIATLEGAGSAPVAGWHAMTAFPFGDRGRDRLVAVLHRAVEVEVVCRGDPSRVAGCHPAEAVAEAPALVLAPDDHGIPIPSGRQRGPPT